MTLDLDVRGVCGPLHNAYNNPAAVPTDVEVIKADLDRIKAILECLNGNNSLLSANKELGKHLWTKAGEIATSFHSTPYGSIMTSAGQRVQHDLRQYGATLNRESDRTAQLKNDVTDLKRQIEQRLQEVQKVESSFSWKTPVTAVACVALACLAQAFTNGHLPAVSLPSGGYFFGG